MQMCERIVLLECKMGRKKKRNGKKQLVRISDT